MRHRETGERPVVAMMLESDGPGGAEVLLLQLSEELRRRGWGVFPVLPERGEGWLGPRFEERGFEVETFALRRTLDPQCLFGLLRTLRRRGADLLHAHEFTMAVYGAAAAGLLRRPLVISMHGNQGMTAALRRRLAVRWAFRRSTANVAVSDDLRMHLEAELGLDRGVLSTVHNGIPFRRGEPGRVRREFALEDGEPLILSVGNLIPRKGHLVLLRALTRIRDARPALPWRLVIAGRGPEDRRLSDFVSASRLDHRVVLAGHRDDVPDLHAAADVFAMPSFWEGLPLALLEAMAAGTAVVASDVSGIPEAVTSDVHGLLTPPGDVARLAGALELLLTDARRRSDFARAARKRALSHFTIQRMADDYERLYRSPASSPRPEPAPTAARLGDVPGTSEAHVRA